MVNGIRSNAWLIRIEIRRDQHQPRISGLELDGRAHLHSEMDQPCRRNHHRPDTNTA